MKRYISRNTLCCKHAHTVCMDTVMYEFIAAVPSVSLLLSPFWHGYFFKGQVNYHYVQANTSLSIEMFDKSSLYYIIKTRNTSKQTVYVYIHILICTDISYSRIARRTEFDNSYVLFSATSHFWKRSKENK